MGLIKGRKRRRDVICVIKKQCLNWTVCVMTVVPPQAFQLGLILLLYFPFLFIKLRLEALDVIDTGRAGEQLLLELCEEMRSMTDTKKRKDQRP